MDLKTWEGPRHFVLIDDEHELRPHNQVMKPAATAPLWPLIERSRQIGLHVIAARLPGNWAGQVVMNPFLQKMTGSRSPTLFMDNDPAMVKVFARVSAQQLPPGPRPAGHPRRARSKECWWEALNQANSHFRGVAEFAYTRKKKHLRL